MFLINNHLIVRILLTFSIVHRAVRLQIEQKLEELIPGTSATVKVFSVKAHEAIDLMNIKLALPLVVMDLGT